MILCGSKKGAQNALAEARNILEGDLCLQVNEQKSRIVHSRAGVSYLDVIIENRCTRIGGDKVEQFKDTVRHVARRNSQVNLEQVVNDLNPVLRGFVRLFPGSALP